MSCVSILQDCAKFDWISYQFAAATSAAYQSIYNNTNGVYHCVIEYVCTFVFRERLHIQYYMHAHIVLNTCSITIALSKASAAMWNVAIVAQ